ncbi:MAG: DUF2142 domain-containing protein [Thermodesulfobacteriota bacterium]
MTAASRARLYDAAWLLVMAATAWAVFSMALTSAFNAHPDEKDHVGAGRYYMQYWDPPAVGDERARGAYSNYGVSYLNQLDSVYFFAGKFARLVKPLAGEDHLALRLFNVALFMWLMWLCWRLKGARRLAFLPLFLTPQAWYVFCYFNGDAMPLALSFAVVFLVSGLVELGEAARPEPGRAERLMWGLGLSLGLLLVSKQNYYVFVAYLLAFWGLAAFQGGVFPRIPLGRLALALALAAAVFGARYGVNAWAVRHQPPDVVAKVAEKMAAPEFKPSAAEKGEGFWGSRMRSRGVTLTEMFTGEWKWHVFTLRSALGKYGAMDIEAPLLFYRWFGRAGALFLLLVGIPLAMRGWDARAGLCLWLAFAVLTVGQSLWHSWNNDFQAQGRYLFPILAMTGCLLARFRNCLGRFEAPAWAVGALLWGMSLWSFAAVGLARIPK